MREDLRIPLPRIPVHGLELDLEVETSSLELDEDQWPPLWGVRLSGRLERTGPREVVFRGRVRGVFRLECALGGAEFDCPFDEEVVVYFLPPSETAPEGLEADGEVELAARDLEAAILEGEEIDLLPPMRDQIGLALPLQPRCPGRCLGEDPETCRRLEAGEPVGGEEEGDPRWAALKGWERK